MPVASGTRMTAREYLKLPQDPPGVRHELVDGEVVLSPSPNLFHSRVDRRLTHILIDHIDTYALGDVFGDVDNAVAKFTVRRPDVFYFSTARLHLVATGAVLGPPDMCAEIISPSSGKIDRVDKLREYAAYGVANYWIFDPAEKTAEAYILSDGTYVLAAKGQGFDRVHFPPFPNLEIPLEKLWWPTAPSAS